MSEPYKVQPLPPTDGITDPQARAFADAVVSAWRLRNGEQGANDQERFITKKEFQGLTANSLAGIFGGADSAMPLTLGGDGTNGPNGGIKITNAVLVKTLTESILRSRLFKELGQEIQLVNINKLTGIVGAGISAERTIRITKDNALAAAVNRVWAYVGDGGALIEDVQLAAVTPASAIATAWTQVQAALTDPNTGLVSSAAIRSTYEAYVSNVDSTMNASYIVQAQLSIAGETIVGGFGLQATAGAGSPQGPQIMFGVRADTFFIAGTTATPSLATQLADNKAPFIVVTTVQTIDGITYQPGVYMKTAFIVDASIDFAKIKTATIGTLQLANNAVSLPLSHDVPNVGVTLSAAWVTVATVSNTFGIPASGSNPAVYAKVNAQALAAVYPTGATGGHQINCRIVMDGALIGNSYGQAFASGLGGTVQCAANADNVLGSHTFEFQIQQSVGTLINDVGPANLTVMGVYR